MLRNRLPYESQVCMYGEQGKKSRGGRVDSVILSRNTGLVHYGMFYYSTGQLFVATTNAQATSFSLESTCKQGMM